MSRLRAALAGTGLGWFAAVCLFGAAVALAAAGMWLAATLPVMGCTYLAGRWDGHRELAALKARERRLDDELNEIHKQRQSHAATNGAGHLSPAALNDRNSNTTADRGVPAQVRADLLP